MPKKNRADWLRTGMRRIARSGVEDVRVESLAKELGVTKGSFYWHFGDRAELLDAILEEWSESATEAVIAQTEAASTEPRERLERLVNVAIDGFDGEFELALRNWGRRDATVRTVLEGVDRQRMKYLRRLLLERGLAASEAEARAFLLYSALIGDYLLPHSHGRFSRKRVLRESVELLVSPGASKKPCSTA